MEGETRLCTGDCGGAVVDVVGCGETVEGRGGQGNGGGGGGG